MKKAIIVGSTGQDGTCLKGQLAREGYSIVGISSKGIEGSANKGREFSVLDPKGVEELIGDFQPAEVYYLAAVHQSSSDRAIEEGELFRSSLDINVKGPVNFLEALRKHAPKARFFYAASSHVFGDPAKGPQNESTPFDPVCIYGVSKVAGIGACRYYRNEHRLFAAAAYFYNHESPYRDSKYVSKKIVEAAVGIKKGKRKELVLGDLDARIDWGYADDYMRAARTIINHSQPEEFIVSSGRQHTIRDFVNQVFGRLQMDPAAYLRIDSTLITKKPKLNLWGDPSRLQNLTGWKPTVDFNGLIGLLVDTELKKYE